MSKRIRNTILACAVLALAALGTAAVALGVPGQGAKDPLAAIRADTQAIRAAVTDRATGLKEIKREIRLIQGRSNRLEVQAEVNEAACASGFVQCGDGGTGHTFAPASSANHNPVEIALLVTLNGAPTAGLASAAFDFSDGIVPAGGPGIVRCPAGGSGCASPGTSSRTPATGST